MSQVGQWTLGSVSVIKCCVTNHPESWWFKRPPTFILLTNLQLEQGSVGTVYFCSTWHQLVQIKIWNWRNLKAYSFIWLVINTSCGLEPYLGLSARAPVCGLFVCLGLPHRMLAEVQRWTSLEKKIQTKVGLPLRPNLRNYLILLLWVELCFHPPKKYVQVIPPSLWMWPYLEIGSLQM